MTYCVGMKLDSGLVFMSDTRTNSGVDNISTFRKMYHWEQSDERIIAVMSSGNLATTQSVISQLEERNKAPEDRHNSLMEAPTMFYAVALTLAVAGAGHGVAVAMAWVYVGLRIIHSLVQVTSNHIPTRFAVFVLSTLAQAVLVLAAPGPHRESLAVQQVRQGTE